MIRKSLIRPLFLILGLCGMLGGSVLPVASQPLQPYIQGFPPRVYGSHSQVFCVEESQEGIMRFGTLNYILNYDGSSWDRNFVKNGTAIASMASDPNASKIWIGGQGDLGYYQKSSHGRDSSDGGFVSLLSELPNPDMRVKMVWNTLRTEEHVFFNDFQHLFVFDGEKMQVHEPRSERFFHAFKVDNTLLVQDSTLRGYQKESGELRSIPGSQALAPYSVTSILPWSKERERMNGLVLPDTLFIATKRNGLFLYEPQKRELFPFADHLQGRIKKLGVQTAHLLPPSKTMGNARLALGTITGGVLFLDQKGRAVLKVDQDDGLENDLIWDLFYDQEQGVLWVSTNKGISRLETMSRVSHSIEGQAFKGKVLDILRLSAGNEKKEGSPLFIATSQGCYKKEQSASNGLQAAQWKLIPGTAGQCVNLLQIGPKEFLVNQNRILKVHKEGGEWRGDLFEGRNFYRLSKLPGEANAYAAAGTDGLLLFRITDEGSEEMAHPLDHLEGVSTTASFGQNDPNLPPMLWIGSMTEGLYRVHPDPKAGWEEPRIFRSDSSDGLPPGRIRVFQWHGRPIIATSQGLFRPERSQGGSVRYGVEELSYVRDEIHERAFGGKWKDRSIFRFRAFSDSSFWIQAGKLSHWTLDQGGWKVDTNSLCVKPIRSVRSILQDPYEQDLTWFGHDNGLTRYNKGVEETFHSDFPCLVRKVKGIRKREKGDKKEHMLLYEGAKKDVQAQNALPFSRNELIFQFAAPYFRREKSTEYRYRLVGYDRKWSEWGMATQKEYTNLNEGNYSFKVQARNAYWKKSRVGTYRFRVLPPWYRTWWAYGGYGMAGAGFVLLMVRLNGRRLRKQKERLEKIVRDRTQEIREQKERVEEAHREISDSIDYAQRIQDALLQSEEYVSTHLPEHFILFKPQARVSGDFYWAREQDDHLYFAAMDCTGHGVPGAFMSMLGVAFLNDILSKNENPEPGEVLSELRERVVKELTDTKDHGQLQDGMDAALLKIPIGPSRTQGPENRKIQFAGAQNPLYVIREGIANEDPDTLLEDLSGPSDLTGLGINDRIKPFKGSPDGIEIKGDPMPVGYDEHASGDFTTVSLKLQKEDMLYIFSDGYADQFGGPKGKKFRYGPFKKLLVELHQKPLEEQKEELDRTFEDWKAESGQEQIDDVLLIGIRSD